jgi:hypothetical protein
MDPTPTPWRHTVYISLFQEAVLEMLLLEASLKFIRVGVTRFLRHQAVGNSCGSWHSQSGKSATGQLLTQYLLLLNKHNYISEKENTTSPQLNQIIVNMYTIYRHVDVVSQRVKTELQPMTSHIERLKAMILECEATSWLLRLRYLSPEYWIFITIHVRIHGKAVSSWDCRVFVCTFG